MRQRIGLATIGLAIAVMIPAGFASASAVAAPQAVAANPGSSQHATPALVAQSRVVATLDGERSLRARKKGRWNGKWKTQFGKVTFIQIGKTVIGSYLYDGAGILIGKAKGKRLNANWESNSNSTSGRVKIKLRNKDRQFSGSYYNSHGKRVGPWHAKRKKTTAKIRFNGYSNNVAVLPHYQLGVARISGKVTVDRNGNWSGSARDTDQMTSPSDYHDTRLAMKSVQVSKSGTGFAFTFQVAVTQTNHASICPNGATGSIRVIDDQTQVASSNPSPQTSDGISSEYNDGKCPTHTQGWNNTDGGARTSPSYGGYPGGGQWARVKIS